MSVERLFHWLCDYCGLKVEKEGHGFPNGWKWARDGKELKHGCPDCQKAHGHLNFKVGN